jgi:hypothetical protein
LSPRPSFSCRRRWIEPDRRRRSDEYVAAESKTSRPKSFGTLPDGRTWGSTAGVDIGPDGQLWAYDRCGANGCAGTNVDQFIPPHALSTGVAHGAAGEGVAVDRDGNVFAAEGPLSREAAGGGITKYTK